MNDSIERVRAVIGGRTPDRPPLYELLRNDAVLEHFAQTKLTLDNNPETVFRAYEPAVDATRPMVRIPQAEGVDTLEDGRQQRRYRWTTWAQHRQYADVDDYARAKRRYLDQFSDDWNTHKQQQIDDALKSIDEHRRKLGEVFFFPSGPCVGMMGTYGEIGLEHFCYYLADVPDLIDQLLQCRTLEAIAWVEHLPADHGIEAVFCGDDIAFNSGPMLSPAWFDEHYMPRLSRLVDAYHRRHIKVLFHSDGNLNLILDQLVAAGIDGLNPIEVTASMDVGDIHRRHPHLFMAGGIDVSQLLPLGTPQQVADTVRRTIDAAGGRLMVGSSTELHDEVPLANYLALRDTVLQYAG